MFLKCGKENVAFSGGRCCFSIVVVLNTLHDSFCQAKSPLGSSQHSLGQMASSWIWRRRERTKGLEPRTAPQWIPTSLGNLQNPCLGLGGEIRNEASSTRVPNQCSFPFIFWPVLQQIKGHSNLGAVQVCEMTQIAVALKKNHCWMKFKSTSHVH